MSSNPPLNPSVGLPDTPWNLFLVMGLVKRILKPTDSNNKERAKLKSVCDHLRPTGLGASAPRGCGTRETTSESERLHGDSPLECRDKTLPHRPSYSTFGSWLAHLTSSAGPWRTGSAFGSGSGVSLPRWPLVSSLVALGTDIVKCFEAMWHCEYLLYK